MWSIRYSRYTSNRDSTLVDCSFFCRDWSLINPSRSGIDFCLFKEIDRFHLLNIYFRDIWDYLLRGDYELPCCCGSHGSFTTAISLSGWLYWVDTGQTPKTHLHQQDRLKPSCWIIFLTRKALGLSSSSSSSTSWLWSFMQWLELRGEVEHDVYDVVADAGQYSNPENLSNFSVMSHKITLFDSIVLPLCYHYYVFFSWRWIYWKTFLFSWQQRSYKTTTIY